MTLPFLIVEGGGTLFALEQSLVREIVPFNALTRLPGAPPYVSGLANVRGTLVTVVNLSRRFGGAPIDATNDQGSIVIAVTGERLLGLLVDDVHEVAPMSPDELLRHTADPPDQAVAGLGHFGERIVLAVDLQELVRQTLA